MVSRGYPSCLRCQDWQGLAKRGVIGLLVSGHLLAALLLQGCVTGHREAVPVEEPLGRYLETQGPIPPHEALERFATYEKSHSGPLHPQLQQIKQSYVDEAATGTPRLKVQEDPQEINLQLQVDVATDPLLADLAEELCSQDIATDQLQQWIDQSTEIAEQNAQQYLLAAVLSCQQRYQEANPIWVKVIKELIQGDLLATTRASFALEQYVRGQRALGERFGAWKTYERLVTLLRGEGVAWRYRKMEDANTLALHTVNQSIWLARYAALNGRYKVALDALKQVEKDLEALYEEDLTPEQAGDLADLHAESYHVRAFRIEVELGNFKIAAALAKQAGQIRNLTKAWQERFAWTEGLYQFASGGTEEACSRWQSMLSQASSSQQPRLLFWIGRCRRLLGDDEASKNAFTQLATQYPFSYYSVVGGAKEPTLQEAWLQRFPDPSVLDDSEVKPLERELATDPIYADKDLLESVKVLRALAAMGLTEDAKPLVAALYDRVRRAPQLPAETLLYLSRLSFRAGSLSEALLLSRLAQQVDKNILQQHPEQLLFDFPIPYLQSFQDTAEKEKLSRYLLVAVARQESLFQPDARSPVGALGLMQLMPHTAERLGYLMSKEPDQLLDPNTNIAAGGAYLSQLERRYIGVLPNVLAAYNAGEDAVDRWRSARPKGDVLLWIEFIPFGQTAHYVKVVWRNLLLYDRIYEFK